MDNDDLEKIASDFQCSVCGAIFATDQDKRQHLEKEVHGEAHEGATSKDAQSAQEQIGLSEGYKQRYESTV